MQFSSVHFGSVSHSCLTLQPHEPQHARPPCLCSPPSGRGPAEGRVERRSHVAYGRWLPKGESTSALWLSCFWSLVRESSSCKRREKLLLHTGHRGPDRGPRGGQRWEEDWCPVLCSVTLFCPGLLTWVPPARVRISFSYIFSI